MTVDDSLAQLVRRVRALEAQAMRPGPEVGAALISQIALTAPAASISFASIPQVFRHLRLIGSARTTEAVLVRDALLRFNGDASALYHRSWIRQLAGAVAGGTNLSATELSIGNTCGASSISATRFGTFVIDIPNYTQTDKSQAVSARNSAFPTNTAADFQSLVIDGYWRTAAAITDVSVFLASDTFETGTTWSLHGV